MDINKSTTLFYDREEKTTLDKNNDRLFNRMINTHGLLNNNYNSITNNIGLYQNNKSGLLQNIDHESNLLNGTKGFVNTCNKLSNKNLKTRVFVGTPLKKSNVHKEMNADISSQLLQGKLITKSKLTDKLSGITINRFTPLVPKVQQEVKGYENSILTFIRNGANTRNNLRSIRYDSH